MRFRRGANGDTRRVGRLLLGLGAPAILSGCASYGRHAAETVATHQVARDFYRARYEEACHVQDYPAWCVGRDMKLNAYDAHLREAGDSLKWVEKGARMPLQLGLLAADKKGLK